MNEYPFKRGVAIDSDRILGVIKECFPSEVETIDNKFVISYKALKTMEVWVDGKKLCVNTESNTDIDIGEVSDTNKRFRKFLDTATGYTAKERVKKMKKSAK
ncbi:MAG: hypothetical protein EF813_04735 [Methanosarcinales archaeon]|nr:MAG: hypothetical protein EF813_04735 [Methanosarcinales archaeon]